MTRTEFTLPQPDWEGPIALDFSLFSRHTKTARYKCRLKKHMFDFYAPLFLLDGLAPGELPERLQIVIGKESSPVRTMGFLSKALPLRIESDTCAYELTKENINSKRYEFDYEGQTYALYIPNEVFEGRLHPRRVFVKMGVSSIQ